MDVFISFNYHLKYFLNVINVIGNDLYEYEYHQEFKN